MKYFVKKLIYFFIPIVILAIPTDFIISYILKQSHLSSGEFEVWNDIFQGNIKANIAIMGSSRAVVQFNTKILERNLRLNVYNFGMNGNRFHIQYFRHLQYLKYNIKPENLIISLDVFEFQTKRNFYYPQQFLPYMLWNRDMFDNLSKYDNFKKIDFFIPLIRFYDFKRHIRDAVNEIIKRKSKKYRYKGFNARNFSWNNDLQNAKKKMKEYVVKIDTTTFNLFNNFITDCQNNRIKVILVYSPEYIEGQQFVTNRKEIMKIYKNLALKHNLELLDYSDCDISYNKDFFYNSNHLNSKGADLFTRKLVEDLKSKNLLVRKN